MTPGVVGGIVFELASTDSCVAVDLLPDLRALHATARELPVDVLGPPRVMNAEAIAAALMAPTVAIPAATRLCRVRNSAGLTRPTRGQLMMSPATLSIPSLAVGFFIDIGDGSLVVPVSVRSWKPGLRPGDTSHWRARSVAFTAATAHRRYGGPYHGLRAHLACIALLDRALELDLAVKVWDWSGYWRDRKSGNLFYLLKASTAYAAAAATIVRSVWGSEISAPSLDAPDHGGDENALEHVYWPDIQALVKRTGG